VTGHPLRGDYGGLALVFAELAGRLPRWQQALEGWNVIESQQVLEWQRQSAVKARREDLRVLLEHRFGPLPIALLRRINALDDAERLRVVFREALSLKQLDEFQL
jgi:hypothetical protein